LSPGTLRARLANLAKALNLDPERVSACLNQLANAGEIKKHAHGYSI